MTLLENSVQTHTVEDALNAARLRIQVTPAELTEARQRRDDLRACLAREFGGRTYVNGSIAHGDALNPLTDVDLGVIVPNPEHEYGPDRRGPRALQDRAADAIRRDLKDKYPNLRVENNDDRHRSILVRFGDPVAPGEPDFTADVITAIDNPDGAGLFIPKHATWDRSHPERHTDLVKTANEKSKSTFARGTRLIKHWNRKHDKPICSWNIKALALDVINKPVSMTDYILTFLNHAIGELQDRETPDPAGVAGPIKINDGWTRTQAVAELRDAKGIFDKALEYQHDGYPILALDEFAKFFKNEEMMPKPNQDDVHLAARAWWKERNPSLVTTAPAASTSPIGDRLPTRSWSC